MSRLNPDCWLWSPRTPLGLLPQSPGSLPSVMLSHREEEEEEEEEEHPADCCYTTAGRDDVISEAAGAQWSTYDPPILSGIPSSSGLAERGPGAPSSQQPAAVMEADGEDMSRSFTGGGCWEGPRTETRGCVCVYGQREPEGLGPCWPGSPYSYYGVRRKLLVGVEVVEEDTLEVITEDIYTEDLLDPELLQDAQMFPT